MRGIKCEIKALISTVMVLTTLTFSRYHNYFFMPKMNEMVRARYDFKNMPKLEELEQRTAIMLINYDTSVDFPEPLQPNVVQVGGLQIVDPKPLDDVR
jgi:hypothetical protein